MIIFVVALLVLMALMGTAYVSTSSNSRYSAQQNSFNTEIDLLLNAAIELEKDAIASAAGNPASTPSGKKYDIITSPDDVASDYLADRLPMILDGVVTGSNGSAPLAGTKTAGWHHISSPAINTNFESPILDASGQIQKYFRGSYVPDTITVTINGQSTVYPALRDPISGAKFLAASASGDGIADAGLWRMPIGSINGITYYVAARIIDNNSAVNLSVAYKPNDATDVSTYANDLYGNFFPTNVDLQGMLQNGGGQTVAQQMTALNNFRWNGTSCSLSMVYDTNPAMSGPLASNWVFISPYDAMWQQLGRRLGNPGFNGNTGKKFQALSASDTISLAHRFCLIDGNASPSLVETMLGGSVRASSIRSQPYSPQDVASWYSENFNYASGGNIRPLLTSRNPTSNISPSRLILKDISAKGAYAFGDMIVDPTTRMTYVCVMDNGSGSVPTIPATGNAASGQAWELMPWTNYPVKTSINTADFNQLWLAFNSVIADDSGNVPPTDATNAPTDTTQINSTQAMLRSPIRGANAHAVGAAAPPPPPSSTSGTMVNGQPVNDGDMGAIQGIINASAPGDTVTFSGTFHLKGVLRFPAGRTYTGGGGVSTQLFDLTPQQVMKLRSALAAINAQQLRSRSNDVLSHMVTISGALAPVSSFAGGSTTFIASNGPAVNVDYGTGGGATTVQGITFQQGGITSSGIWDTLTVTGCQFQQISSNAIDLSQNVTNSTFSKNLFTNVGGTGITGWCGNNNKFKDNGFDYTFEPIHIFAGGGNEKTEVSGNVIRHATRIGIEMQEPFNNLTVANNYISDWLPHLDSSGNDSHMALSLACGGWEPNTPGNPHPGQQIPCAVNMQITGNTLLQTGPAKDNSTWAKFAIEIMGGDVTVANNYIADWGGGLLLGNDGPVVSMNNIFVGDNVYGDYVEGDSTPWPNPTIVLAGGDRHYANDASAPAPPSPPSMPTPPPPTTGTPPQTGTASFYNVMVYGAAQQPYITEVYANNDLSTVSGYVAVELYNPYSYDMPLRNWVIATLPRTQGNSSLSPTQISTDWSANYPVVPAGGYLIISTPQGNAPAGVTPPHVTGTGPSVNFAIEPGLSSALGQELVFLRPRRADGSLSVSPDPATPNAVADPNNTYDEKNLADRIPADSYDFTGLNPPDATQPPVYWHYLRPNDPAQKKAWHFVYPGHYKVTDPSTQQPGAMAVPRQGGTAYSEFTPGTLIDLSTTAPYAFGAYKATTLDPTTYRDAPLQLNNTDTAGPNKNATAFPFGGFARNGDILQTTFIGAYRIQYQGGTLELNAPTMDAAFADDLSNAAHTGENIGRFCLIHPSDYSSYDDLNVGGKRSPYYFARRLFDFLSVHAPSYDFLPNIDDPSRALAQPVANNNPAIANNTTVGSTSPTVEQTEDNVGTDGLININTAGWRVLATLPMVDDPATNQKLAQAIVAYRDGDAANNMPAHGAFNNIFELLGVPAYAATATQPFRNTLGQYKTGNFDPMNSDPGNADGDLSPYNANSGATDKVVGDFESQFLALTRISNLITTRSDTFTVYLQVQGWRNAGTSSPELVVQRRAAFLADRSAMIPSNRILTTTNVPAN